MTTGIRREPITLADRPITLADRRARGWMKGLEEGFAESEGYGSGTDAAEIGRQSLRASGAKCAKCGQVGLDWKAYADTGYTRIFDVCPTCGHSREIFEPQHPRHAAPRQTAT